MFTRTNLMLRILVGVVCLWLMATPAPAQAKDDGLFARIFKVTAKNRAQPEFANEYKNYLAARKQRRDPWKWYAWQVISGRDAGAVFSGSFGHFWADFDATVPTDVTDSLPSLLPSGDFLLNAYTTLRPELGRIKSLEDNTNSFNYIAAEYYELWPGREQDFEYLLRVTRDAHKRAREPRNYACYRVFNGGRQPLYLILTPFERAADIQIFTRDFTAVWEETLAPANAAELREIYKFTVREMNSEMLRYSPGLSYIP